MAASHPQSTREPLPSVLTVVHCVYILHTVAIAIGIIGTATVVVYGALRSSAQAISRRTPSSTPTCASHPNSCLALVGR